MTQQVKALASHIGGTESGPQSPHSNADAVVHAYNPNTPAVK